MECSEWKSWTRWKLYSLVVYRYSQSFTTVKRKQITWHCAMCNRFHGYGRHTWHFADPGLNYAEVRESRVSAVPPLGSGSGLVSVIWSRRRQWTAKSKCNSSKIALSFCKRLHEVLAWCMRIQQQMDQKLWKLLPSISWIVVPMPT